MPRRKSKASPNFYATPHTLSESARSAMAECLGTTLRELDARADGYEFWWDAEQWLGAYAPSVEHVNLAPSASQYVEEFAALADQALQLANRIANLGGYLSAQLDRRKFDTDTLESSLAQFHDTARAIAAEYKGRGKRGARGDIALLQTIRSLRLFFDRNYCGPKTARKRQGAFVTRSEMEQREERFVQTALRDARIIPANYRGLRRQFRHPSCLLPHEATATKKERADVP